MSLFSITVPPPSRQTPNTAAAAAAGAGTESPATEVKAEKPVGEIHRRICCVYSHVALQRIHLYNVLFPRSRFHVMENSRSGYNVLSL